jgi:mannose-1-phosphate guanylyltransferase
MPNSIYALILAGGSGERFWPLSRRARPKQLLRLVSEKTLLEETLARLEGFVPVDRTLILTNTEQESAVRKLLGSFPKENVIAEPAKRDTAAAVALGTGWVVARDHAATMVVLPADHVIANRSAFQETLTLAADAAEETGELVTIGIKPTWACPGNFQWNAGMFVWSVPTVLREFNRHAPELAAFISQLRALKNFEKALRERFSNLPRISFDYAIMEKADRVLVVEVSFDWDDIGSWRAVANYFEKDKQGNAANCAITALDSSNNIVFEEDGTTIALLGVHDLIVVRTKDALLVCDRHEAEKIKNLIGKLPPELQ